jgi:hypothetical protein
MIIYGTNSSNIATQKVLTKCPGCEIANSLDMAVFQKYAHIFWIPLIPIGKTAATVCSNCKQVLQEKEFPATIAESYEGLKAQTKIPLWTFSGLAIIIALVSWGVISDKQNDKKNAEIILAPQQGDIYEIKTSSQNYTLYKVGQVEADTVYLLINEYETNKPSGFSDLKAKGDDAYLEQLIPFLRSDLKDMLDKGEIIDIDRD